MEGGKKGGREGRREGGREGGKERGWEGGKRRESNANCETSSPFQTGSGSAPSSVSEQTAQTLHTGKKVMLQESAPPPAIPETMYHIPGNFGDHFNLVIW